MELDRSKLRLATLGGCLLFQVANVLPVRSQVTSPTPANVGGEICSNRLSNEISRIIDRAEFQPYHWGVVVQTLSGTQLYNRDGDKLFTPASNLKLLTTAVALRQLGANTRLRTSVYQMPNNSLLVVGRGDPSLTTKELQLIGQQIERRGYRQLSQIYFDDGYFRGEAIAPSWEWGDLSTDYATAANSLILNQNTVALTVSPQQVGAPLKYTWSTPNLIPWQVENLSVTAAANSQNTVNAMASFGKPVLKLTGSLAQNAQPTKIDLAVANPGEVFMNSLRQILTQQQIGVGNTRLVTGQNLTNLREIAFINSPTIAELVNETNLNSNNLYAEVLLKSIGKTNPQHSFSPDSSTDLGLAIVKQKLTELAVNPQGYRLDDGSGLSRHNLVSPRTFVQVLSAMARLPEGTLYRNSLPIAGLTGTLKNRLKNTPAQGRVRAKTGSMTGVISLSGYVEPSQYSPLVFSIIIDRHDRRTSEMAKAIDEVVVLLSRLKQCR